MLEIPKPILIFFATAAVSFAGSLQLGTVNLTVLQTTLRQNLRAGIWVAVGGCLPELIYAAMAIWAANWLERYPDVWQTITWISVPILLILGIVIYHTPNQPLLNTPKTTNVASPFATGFGLGLLNPQLFPYWLLVLIQFGNYDFLRVEAPSQQAAFVAGTAGGALVLLVALARLAQRRRAWLLGVLGQTNTNKWLGIVFGLLALVQCFKMAF